MKRPISFTVIAILMLVGFVADLLLLPDVRFQFESILGIYVYAWTAFYVWIVGALLYLAGAVGLLRCKAWSRFLAMGLFCYEIANTILSGVTPSSFHRFVEALKTSHHIVNYSNSFVPDAGIPVRFLFGIPIFWIPIWCLFVYFLWTQRFSPSPSAPDSTPSTPSPTQEIAP